MAVKIRILGAANKHMQRLGYLKFIAAESTRRETSRLEGLGRPLVNAVMKRLRLTPPYESALREYVRSLAGPAYADIRHAIANNAPTRATVELQDLYLADPKIPSATGKLNADSWEKYPYFATALDLIKSGTWSAMTRSLTLLCLVNPDELAAFSEFLPLHNPLLISREQGTLFLYCLIDHDAEILFRLFKALIQLPEHSFDEKTAGNMLPDIIKDTVRVFSRASLPVEDRERLGHLEKVAGTIASYRNRNYSGTTAREVSVRVRLEPFTDIGFFTKKVRHRFVYQITPSFRQLMDSWSEPEDTDLLLRDKFFATVAKMHGLAAVPAADNEARDALRTAGEQLQSSLGYSPIDDCALLAGIRLLFEKNRILELNSSTAILRAWQKSAPEAVRFTVDRMGDLAYVKFLKPVSSVTHAQT